MQWLVSAGLQLLIFEDCIMCRYHYLLLLFTSLPDALSNAGFHRMPIQRVTGRPLVWKVAPMQV